jgi:hypothetical protein
MELIYNLISVEVFWSILLILHGLISVALLGGLTHQSLSLIVKRRQRNQNILDRFAGVQSAVYTNAVCVLWIVSFFFGGWIYSKYRVAVRIPMEQQGIWITQGLFELKEHLVSLGLFLLPAYYALWTFDKDKVFQNSTKLLTLTLAAICWYSFLIGHIVNNVRGFGS